MISSNFKLIKDHHKAKKKTFFKTRFSLTLSFPSIYKDLLLTEFQVRIVSYGPSFLRSDLWSKREARGP